MSATFGSPGEQLMDPVRSRCGVQGFSLIEVLISVSLLATVSLSVAKLFAMATSATLNAKEQTSTAILAAQKMEQIRGLTWGFESEEGLAVSDTTTDLTTDPPLPGGRGLSPSPAGVLDANTAGYVDYLDAHGKWVGNGAGPPANTRYIRRWSINPLPTSPNDTLVLQVLVTSLRREAEYAGTGRRGRRPGDSWLVTVKTRKEQ